MAIPTIGDRMTDADLFDLNAKKYSLSELCDTYLLLSFWSMTCMVCMKAARDLKVVEQEYRDRVRIVSINMDTALSMWQQGTERDGITWYNLSDGQGSSGGVGKTYGVMSFPAYVLFNPEGIIIDRWMGYKPGRFTEKMQEHLPH